MAHVLPEDIISHWHLIKSVKYGNKAKEEWRSILKVSIILSLYKKKYHEIQNSFYDYKTYSNRLHRSSDFQRGANV